MLFEEQISRKPDKYPWAKDFIQVLWNNPWNVEEFNFSSDIHDFKVKLTIQERQVITRTLSAISQIENSVKTWWLKLGDNLPALRDLGAVFANTETVHNFAYEKLLDVLGLDDVFEKNLKVPVIHGRTHYLRKHTHKFYSDSKKQYLYAMTLFTLFVENVSLFSQFYIINWFYKNKNVFKNVNQQILYTKNEETIHFLGGAKIINVIRQELPDLFDQEFKDKIVKEAADSVSHEIKLVDWMLEGYTGEGLEKETIIEFIKNRMNASLEQINFSKIYDIDQNLKTKFYWFEEEIVGDNFVDFFHQRSTNYSKNNKSFGEEDLF